MWILVLLIIVMVSVGVVFGKKLFKLSEENRLRNEAENNGDNVFQDDLESKKD